MGDVLEGDSPDQARPGAVVRWLMIEQPARWEVPTPGTAPRHFTVHGVLVEDEAGNSTPVLLGAFEYALAAPAAQEFKLNEPALVRSLRLDIIGEGWGAEYTCVYRIRAFGF